MPPSPNTKLKIDDVLSLGETLLCAASLFPLALLTEKDFYPLVISYLSGRVPGTRVQVSTTEGRIDFEMTGVNSTYLELAVQPRLLRDANYPISVSMPSIGAKGALYASQNSSELRKLMYAPKKKTRFLLLLDLRGDYDLKTIYDGYRNEAKKHSGGKSVRVVFVSPSASFHFTAGAKPGGELGRAGS